MALNAKKTVFDARTLWAGGTAGLLPVIEQAVDCTSFALAFLDPAVPRPADFMATRDVTLQTLNQWCEGGAKGDALLPTALSQGWAVNKGSAARADGSPLSNARHVLVQVRPASQLTGRVWCLVLGRSQQAFTEDERLAAARLLRLIQSGFDHIAEAGMHRLLLSDEQAMHADPEGEARYLAPPELRGSLAATLLPVIHQRWPGLNDSDEHTFAIELDGEAIWVRFCRGQAVPKADFAHWYMEFRPLSPDEIPPTGLLDDDRVARALAYLSDHYRQSPSLNELAAVAQTSSFHFHRLFSKAVGISPKHHALRMQLMAAKWLLRNSRVPIRDVASAAGFASHGHFTATFHRLVGVSPSELREASE